MDKKISEIVKQIIEDAKQPVPILEGLTRDTRKIIERIYFYKHDQFVECSNPNAIFWQVVSQYIPHFAKLIDFDPKDLSPKGTGDTNYIQVWILRRKLQAWMQEENFGAEIDDLTSMASSFGSYVWKVVRGEKTTLEPCDLRNLYFDYSCRTLRGRNKVELHYLTEQEIRDKEGAWDNIEELIKNAEDEDARDNRKAKRKIIWEFTGYHKDQFKHTIGAGFGDKETIAFTEKLDPKKDPYYDFHLWEYTGSWLRRGAYEMCFPEQERANTVVNENAEATSIASLLLLRTQDPNTQGNVLQGAISGQIINSSDLQQVGIDNRAFTLLLNELDKIERQVQKKLMLPDIAVGDSSPSGTPFRGMALMSNAYKSAFKQIRNRIATPTVDIMIDVILPDQIKKWNRGDILEIAEDANDIRMYDRALLEKTKLDFYEQANASGYAVTPEDEMMIQQAVEQQLETNGRKVELEKGFFNFKYGLTLDPVGEEFDKGQQNDAANNAIGYLMQNPAIANNPIFKQLLENNGISPIKLTQEEMTQMQVMGRPPQQGIAEPKTDALSQLVDSNV